MDLLAELDPDHAMRGARRDLERQFSKLGSLRDAQVQRRGVDELSLPRSDRRLLRRQLGRRERRFSRKLSIAGHGWVSRKIASASARLASASSGHDENRILVQGLNRALRAARGRAMALQPRRAKDMARLHHARMAIKRYRYLLELLSPVLTGVDAGMLRQLQACQERMGQIHDSELFIARLDSLEAKGKLLGRKQMDARATLERRHASLVAAYLHHAGQAFPLMGAPPVVTPV